MIVPVIYYIVYFCYKVNKSLWIGNDLSIVHGFTHFERFEINYFVQVFLVQLICDQLYR